MLEAIGQSIKSAGDDQNFPLILPDTPALPILLNITDLFLLNKEIPFPNLLNSYVHTCPFFLFCWYWSVASDPNDRFMKLGYFLEITSLKNREEKEEDGDEES